MRTIDGHGDGRTNGPNDTLAPRRVTNPAGRRTTRSAHPDG
jgi:hypothetical protein